MPAGIDMSLDDVIKISSTAESAARRQSYCSGRDSRVAVRNPIRTTPYSMPQAKQEWRGGMVQVQQMDFENVADSGTKLYISNLDYGVSNGDIQLLFSEVGELKRYSLHCDKSGRSKGTAEVVFMRKSDALAAIEKYNNMTLDGKPLQIELVGTSLVTPAVMPLHQKSLLGRPKDDVLVREQGKFGGSRFQSGFAHRHLRRGRGEKKDHIRKVSFKDLDHDLERYHRRPRGHTRKMSVRELDEDLERYHSEATRIDKENGK